MNTLTSEAPGRLRTPQRETPRAWRVWRIGASLLLLLWWLGDLRYAAHGGQWRLVAVALSAALALAGGRRLWPSRASFTFDPSAPLLLLAVFLPEHMLGGGRPLWQQIAPGTAVLLLLLLAAPLRRLSASPLASTDKSTPKALSIVGVAALAAYFLTGSALACLKLHCFGYVGQDVAYFMQCLYTAAHGHLFWANQYHDLLYSKEVWSDFAGHNQPVLFLLVPFYALAPHAETLFIFRNLLLALAAWPAYRLLRLTFAPLPAGILTAAFFLSPALLFQNFYDYAPLSLVALPLLFALLFYAERRFPACLVALCVCLLIREDLVIALIALGVIALIERRQLRWILAPITLGLAWGVFSWGWVMPHFLHGAVSAVASCFAYLGATPFAILRSAALHPQLLLTHNTISYGLEMLSPYLLFTPAASPFSLAALPYFVINVLGDRGCDAAIVFRHYALIPSIFLLPAVSSGWRWWRKFFRPLACSECTYALLLLAAAGLSTILSVGPAEAMWFHAPSWRAEAIAVSRSLPRDAAVAVPRYMLPLVANRNLVYQSARLLEYHHPDAEYVVVDRNPARMGVSDHNALEWQALDARLHNAAAYRLLSSTQNFLIYQRLAPSQPAITGSGHE